jgi:hypothetical protein
MESLETWCWRRIEKSCWTDRVRNEVLYRVMEEKNSLIIKRKKANQIGHIWCRNYFPIQFIERKLEGRIAVTGSRGRRLKQLLSDINEKRGYWQLKKEALDNAA